MKVNNLLVRLIKSIDISLISIYYLICGVLVSIAIERLFYSKKKDVDKVIIFIRILARTSLIGICAYFIRLIIKQIPFPLNGIMGYDHTRLKERFNGGIILAFSIVILQTGYVDDIKKLTENLFIKP